MNKVAVAAALAVGSVLSAADTKTIKSREGNCQVAVPASWQAADYGSLANSADKKVTVIVSSPKMVDSFSELKQTARGIYKNSKVTKDSASEFEMEGQSITGKPDVYRAVPVAGNKFCIADVTYESGMVNDAKKIAETLASGK